LASRPEAPHADELDIAVEHYNATVRHRYRLPATTAAQVRQAVGFDETWADIPTVRAGGVIDASCAIIAKAVLSIVPRYAIGMITADGSIYVLAPEEGDEESYRIGHVLLVNPLGGRNNWKATSRWVREHGGEKARRMLLAGLASEERPDEAANRDLLRAASAAHGRAIALPPDEAFSAERAEEVSYIYGVPVETLRAWKRRYRMDLAARKPGAPRKNR